MLVAMIWGLNKKAVEQVVLVEVVFPSVFFQ